MNAWFRRSLLAFAGLALVPPLFLIGMNDRERNIVWTFGKLNDTVVAADISPETSAVLLLARFDNRMLSQHGRYLKLLPTFKLNAATNRDLL